MLFGFAVGIIVGYGVRALGWRRHPNAPVAIIYGEKTRPYDYGPNPEAFLFSKAEWEDTIKLLGDLDKIQK